MADNKKLKISPSRRSRLPTKQTRSKVMQYPILIERRYETQLTKLMKEYESIVKTMILATLPKLETEFKEAIRVDSIGVVRMDEFDDSVSKMMTSILSSFNNKLQFFEDLVKNNAEAVNKWNKEQTNEFFKEKLGVDILSNDKDLDGALNMWVKDNVREIGNVAVTETKRFEKIILDGYRNGLRHEEVAKGIFDAFRPASDRVTSQASGMGLEKRAKLIAREEN